MTSRLLALVLPAVLLTGCGGGSDSADQAAPSPTASTTPAGLSKADFVAKAEAVCTKANAEVDAQPAPSSPAELGPAFQALLTTADRTTGELEQLAAPQPDKAELDRIFLTPLRGQVTALQAYVPQVTAAAAKGQAAVEALPEPDVPDADLAAMKAYGFTACVETATND